MDENEREETIKKLMLIVKEFHSNKKESYDWLNKIKNDILNKINECKTLFSKEDYNMIINSINKYDNYLIDNRFALIHNDLHFDNIIYNNGVLKIIDFNDSIYAPIDFEFRQLYMCQEKPWKWANIEMDPYQKPDAYKITFPCFSETRRAKRAFSFVKSSISLCLSPNSSSSFFSYIS